MQSPHLRWLASLRIDPTLMRPFVWTGLVLVLVTAIGFGWLMLVVPPPPAHSKQETLRWVRGHQTSILIGATLVTFFCSFEVTWAAPIILYIRRMERVPLLTFAPLGNVGGGAAVNHDYRRGLDPVMAFRAQEPVIVQAFNDLGFFLFLYTWPPFRMVIIAVAIQGISALNRPSRAGWPTTTSTPLPAWRQQVL
jgi:hypothetical protein